MPFRADWVGHPVVLAILGPVCLASVSWQSRSALYSFFSLDRIEVVWLSTTLSSLGLL